MLQAVKSATGWIYGMISGTGRLVWVLLAGAFAFLWYMKSRWNGRANGEDDDDSTNSTNGELTPKRSNRSGSRRMVPIRESEDDDQHLANGHLTVQGQPRRRRLASRNKLHSGDGSASNCSDDSPPQSVTPKLRRHSTGPWLAGLVRGERKHKSYPRQMSLKSSLPRPPTEFFEPSNVPEIPGGYTPEVYHIVQYLRTLELPEEAMHVNADDVEVITKLPNGNPADEYLFKLGDSDDSLYIVMSGQLSVVIQHEGSKKEFSVKYINPGQSLFSLLSFIDVLTGTNSVFKTVSAKAVVETQVARYRVGRFHELYKQNPKAWTRPIQVVITRLVHMTMTTLHEYLGLSSELTKHHVSTIAVRRQPLAGAASQPAAEVRTRHASSVSTGHAGTTRKDVIRRRRLSSADGEKGERCPPPKELDYRSRRYLAEALCLDFDDVEKLLGEKIRILCVDSGEKEDVVKQGSTDEPRLMMLLSGQLLLVQDVITEDGPNDERLDGIVNPGEMVGGLQLLSGEPAFYTVRAQQCSWIATISKVDYEKLLEDRPQIVLPVARSVMKRLSPFIRAIDFALDWQLIDSGQAVYRQGERADSLFVVLSGRLRSVIKQADNKTVVEEFGRGDIIGLIELLQKRPRSTTVLAVRYSQLAGVPEGLLNFIKLRFPQVGFRMVQLLGHYYTSYHRRLISPVTIQPKMHNGDNVIVMQQDPMSHIKNLHTIAIMPASRGVPLVAFTCELYHALSSNLDSVLRLSSNKVIDVLGASVFDKDADIRLMHWLNGQEDGYRLVLYECDFAMTNWTRRCLRQADAVLVVANGITNVPNGRVSSQSKARKPIIKSLDKYFTMKDDVIRTNKELILLWREDVDEPSSTFQWLKSGGWFSGHHHVRAPDRMFKFETGENNNGQSDIESLVVDYYERTVFSSKVDFYSDFSRLSRLLTGNAVGLVLGGGGARGAAHVGVICAMREHGIPIDIVGGVSIGSLIGALFCAAPEKPLAPKAKQWFDYARSIWNKLWDITYGYTAMFTGKGFNRSIQDVIGETKYIEDLWIPFFTITTDITSSEMRVHRSGSLWTYVRSSMSLAGYLPPLCDPNDGHLLLDGGYVNNLPADVMRSFGAKCVIAVDVGSADEIDLHNYGDHLSGWWVLLQRMNPWGKPCKILNAEEIQSRLAFVSCVRQLEQVKKAHYCHYFRPPIAMYKTLEFDKFDEIAQIGYDYGTKTFDDLVQSNQNIKEVMNPEKLKALNRHFLNREMLERKMRRAAGISDLNSFTELAAELSKIPGICAHHEIADQSFDENVFSENDENFETTDDNLDLSDDYDGCVSEGGCASVANTVQEQSFAANALRHPSPADADDEDDTGIHLTATPRSLSADDADSIYVRAEDER